MDMDHVSRIAAFVGALTLITACASADKDGAVLEEAANSVPARSEEGTIPDYCPKVSLREGTAILRKRSGETVEYVASVTDTSRECRIIGGEMRMKIGVAGRVVPGPASKGETVTLPIRIAVVRGTDVLYSAQGSQAVTIAPGEAAGQFVYVDAAVSLPVPERKNLVIYAGFDEGAPQ